MKYTKELLTEVSKNCLSVSQVVRKLRGDNKSGSFNTYISGRLKEFDIDTSHFLGQSINKGKIANNKQSADSILIEGKIEKHYKLKRALLESGVDYECSLCTNEGTWQSKALTLQIDHIDGIRTNNKKNNLRFLCPNCHSQTETFGAKNVQKV